MICVCLPRNSFNPSLFRFVAISAVLCHCFKAMLLVRILAEQCLTHASYCWAVLSCGTVHLIIMLYKVVLTTGSMNEIQKCYHSDESYWAVLSCHMVMFIMLYKVVLILLRLWKIPVVCPCKWKPLCQYFPIILLITLYKVAHTFESFNKIL